jgi:hypothetical protein
MRENELGSFAALAIVLFSIENTCLLSVLQHLFSEFALLNSVSFQGHKIGIKLEHSIFRFYLYKSLVLALDSKRVIVPTNFSSNAVI